MVWGSVRSFSDPLSYQHALQGGEFEFLPTTRGTFSARLTQIRLNKIWMTRGEERLAGVLSGSMGPDRVMVGFHTDAGLRPVHHCGTELSSDVLIVNNSDLMHRRTGAAGHWGSISLTRDELASAGKTLCGRALDVASMAGLVRANPTLMARLLYLHQRIGQLVGGAVENLEFNEVFRAIENDVVHVTVRCLDEGSPLASTQASRNHTKIIRRLEEFLIQNLFQPLYLADICAATGTSEAILRACCQEQFGMGPVRYLWSRRMHLVRRALLLATSETATVTQTALDHGFWELGRFSTQYRSLFGEAPSATLRQTPPRGLVPQPKIY